MNKPDEVTESSRQVAKRFYDYLATANFEGVLSCLHEDVEVHEPGCLPYGGVYRGLDGVKKLFSLAPRYLDVGAFHVEAIVADGERVVGMLETFAISNGARITVAEESIVRDGKIVRVRVFLFDPTLVGKLAT